MHSIGCKIRRSRILRFAAKSRHFRDCPFGWNLSQTLNLSCRSDEAVNESTLHVRIDLCKMSDDEADPELLELLRQTLGLGQQKTNEVSKDTGTCFRSSVCLEIELVVGKVYL